MSLYTPLQVRTQSTGSQQALFLLVPLLTQRVILLPKRRLGRIGPYCLSLRTPCLPHKKLRELAACQFAPRDTCIVSWRCCFRLSTRSGMIACDSNL